MAAPEKQNLALREFRALNTQPARQVIADQEFYWLQEFMPIGHGNLKMVPGQSASIASIVVGGQSIYYWMAASINAANYVYCFLTDGSAYEVNTDTGTVVNFAPANTFSGAGTRAAQWKNERILIVDPQHGYFSYDRQTLISYQNTIYSVSITQAGAAFTTAPTIVATGGGGTGAVFASTIGAGNVNQVVTGGTGYQIGDILTITGASGTAAGGTFTTVATIRVTAVNTSASNAITGAVVETPGAYTIAPQNPVSVTGGYGTLATFNLGFLLSDVTVSNRGSGYTTIPTLLVNPSSTVGSQMTIATSGNYTTAPSNPITVTGGTGSNLTVTGTFGLISAPGAWMSSNGASAGYQIGDVLTLTGGTSSSPATIQITNITSFTVGTTYYSYSYSILTSGNYTIWPANGTFGTTGGHGSGLVVGIYTNLFGTQGFASVMGLTYAVIANAGSGYHDGNTLTVAGGIFSTPATLTYKSGGVGGGAVLTANLALSISGTAIASYSGHVWIVTNSRTVVFSAPDSFDDFLTSDGAGSFILSDEQMKSQITAIKTANDYLYIFGLTSVFIVSGVALQTVQGASPITTFNLNNITTSVGTDLPDGMLAHYRSMIFGSDYGWYMLTGSTPQKISDPLDGFLNRSTLSNVTSGKCIVYGQLCECWLVDYTYPVSNVTVAVIIVLFNGKWFLSIQNSSLKMITGSVYNDTPTLYGTDGVSIYRLFSDTTTPRSFEVQTKLWDMGNSLVTKQITRVGIEVNVQNYSAFIVETDTELGSTINEVLMPIGYNFNRINASEVGNYAGITITGNATPGDSIIGIYMAYQLRTPWTDAKSDYVPSIKFITWINNSGSTITWTNSGVNTLFWIS